MKKIWILLLICTLGFQFSCKKEDDSRNLKSEAVLTWTGDYAVDGCGFFITINDHEYKPENESVIDNNFKLGSVAVILEYQLLDSLINVRCGFSPIEPTDAIKVISIKKK